MRHLNLFLGANNSGKSRLLRAIASMPVRRCLAESAQRRIYELVVCLTEIAGAREFGGDQFVASWLIQGDPLRGYPPVTSEALLTLKQKFEKLAKAPGLLWAFAGALRSFRQWIDSRFSDSPLKTWKVQVEAACVSSTREASGRIPDGADELLLESDRIFVAELANDPFVRMACLAERLKPVALRTSGGLIGSERFAAFNDLVIKLALDMSEVTSPSVYIPVLRTAHILDLGKSEDIFRSTVRRFYGLGAEGDKATALRLEIFTGMDLYRRFLVDRGGRRERRRRFQEFEEFLGQAFFGGKSVDIVSQYASPDDAIDAHHIKVSINDSERELHNLGDGIQALIILLYPIFMADPETWFFIDEPEIHLHPGLQRVLIETLMTNQSLRERNLRYLFTTHSNHLLDPLAAFSEEVSVYSMAQVAEGKFSITCRPAPSVAELDLLGVRNASVLLANCTIWVEGIVDRLYLRTYISAYRDKFGFDFREDIHYAFLEYAGSNIQHYVEGDDDLLMRQIDPASLSNHAIVIADQDVNKEATHRKREAAFGARGMKYVTTGPCIEIENTLSDVILKLVFSGGERLWPEKLKGLDESAVEFETTTLETTRMGTYLQGIFRRQLPTFKLVEDPAPTSKADPAGKTLETGHKTALAKRVCDLAAQDQISWDSLSLTAQKLTETIIAHIRRSNGCLV